MLKVGAASRVPEGGTVYAPVAKVEGGATGAPVDRIGLTGDGMTGTTYGYGGAAAPVAELTGNPALAPVPVAAKILTGLAAM